VGLFVSVVLIHLSQASIITRLARFLDGSGFIVYMFLVLWDIAHAAIFATPGVMVLRLNKSLKYREHIPTPDCSGPAPTFVPFYCEYSIPPVSSTMPEKTPLSCLDFSCRKKFTSDSLRLKHIKVDHPEHLQVAKNLTVHSQPQSIELTQRREFNANKDSVEDLDPYAYLEDVENIADSDSQPTAISSSLDGNIP
jgi:hypothetical protein